MARRVWKSFIRKRKDKDENEDLLGFMSYLNGGTKDILRRPFPQGGEGEVGAEARQSLKRHTINLGTDDIQDLPRPESLARYCTDDDLGVTRKRRSTLLSRGSEGSGKDESDEIGLFLMREYRKVEDMYKLGIYEEGKGKSKSSKTGERSVMKQGSLGKEKNRSFNSKDPGKENDAGKKQVRGVESPDVVKSPPGEDAADMKDDLLHIISSLSVANTLDKKDTGSSERPWKFYLESQVSAQEDGLSSASSTPLPPPRKKRGQNRPLEEKNKNTSEPTTDVFLSTSKSMDSRSKTLDLQAASRKGKNEVETIFGKQKSFDDLLIQKSRQLRRSMSEAVGENRDKIHPPMAKRAYSDKSKNRHRNGSEKDSSFSFRDKFWMARRKSSESSEDNNRRDRRSFRARSKSRQRQRSEGDLLSQGGVAGAQQQHVGSAPSSPQHSGIRSADSSPFRFASYLTKKVLSTPKRTKASSKNEDKSKNEEYGADSEGGGGALSSARSRENLCPDNGSPHDTPTPPLHGTPTHDPQANIVQNSPRDRMARCCSPVVNLCGACCSPRQQSGNSDEERRIENSLKIWVLEAKGVTNKKKYFCKLLLDSMEYGKTVGKVKSNMCFWGEYFEFNRIPQVSTICVELMRETDKKPKRVGEVEIPIKSVTSRTLVERWYDVKTDKPDKEIPALRIKCRFESVDVLPLAQYAHLRKYLRDHSQSLCQLVEPIVSVKTKEDIATNLVHIMQAEGRAVSFLVSLILMDIQRAGENEHLLFRGNSVATKAIDAYMRLVGEHYLRDTLSDTINDLITNGLDCEVDPKRISYPALPKQQETLRACVATVWEKILKSNNNFPVELRQVFHTLRERLSRQENCELTNNLISSCIFLRFLCPAILSPSLFNITKEYPDERASRSLTLVAKTVQTLANFTHFQGKEDFMEFLNDFIDKEQDRCRHFLRTISSSPSERDFNIEFDGGIDLGKNLALLHLHLVEIIAKVNTQGCNIEASRIQELVDDICFQLGERKVHSTNRQMSTPVRLNNNYSNIEDSADTECSPVVGGNLGIVAGCPVLHHTPTLSGAGSQRSLSLPRSMAIAPLNQQAAASPQMGTKRAATDLSTNDDYVLYSALDSHAEPQNFMYPAREPNNNNTTIGPNVGNEHRVSNGNQYYMPGADVIHTGSVHGSPVTPHTGHGRTYPQQPAHTHHYNRQFARSHINNRDEYSELYNYMDSCMSNVHATCMDMENNIQGSQTSISQLSNVASSGYQSFVYSQSSSPVDSLLHTDNNSSLLSRENGNVGILQRTAPRHGSPLHGSPFHYSLLNKHRGVAVHHGYMGQAGHVSLHGTPRHVARVQPPKESPSSSISSSHSVEDLSSARRSRPRHRRSGSTSSDSSPDRQGLQNRVARLPRTNPHCSPRLVNTHHLRSDGHKARTRPDRSSSGRRTRNSRSSADREEFRSPGLQCSYDDSEEEVAVGSRNPIQTNNQGRTNWIHDDPNRRRLSQEDWHAPPDNMSSQAFLNQQEDQMKKYYDRFATMELEMLQEQEAMRRKMTEKDCLIAAQKREIVALGTKNAELRNHIASLTSRPEATQGVRMEMGTDQSLDSCNASDTSDYKSSSC